MAWNELGGSTVYRADSNETSGWNLLSYTSWNRTLPVRQREMHTNSMKLIIPSLPISWKKTPNDAVTPQRQSQFTPKMKANVVLRLLSSLVWIDQYNECYGTTSFMEFMCRQRSWFIPVIKRTKLRCHSNEWWGMASLPNLNRNVQ